MTIFRTLTAGNRSIFKAGGEVGWGVETHHSTDFRNCVFPFFQQLACLVETHLANEVIGRFSCQCFHLDVQVGTAHAHFAGEYLGGKFHVVHVLLHNGYRFFNNSSSNGLSATFSGSTSKELE